MVTLICPSCASRTLAPRVERSATCPRCGSLLEPDADTTAVHGSEHHPARPSDQAEARGAARTLAGSGSGGHGLAGIPLPAGYPDTADSDGSAGVGLAAEDPLIAELQEAFSGFAIGQRRTVTGWLAGGPDPVVAGDITALPAGALLGDFEIVRELGRGGMGTVYRARQVSLAREVALKVLPGAARGPASGIARFKVEAQAAARLKHPNIVAVHTHGVYEGHVYYAMELIEGADLDTCIRRRASRSAAPARRWTPRELQNWARRFAEVADALECAHRAGIVHRDVKPHNLLLDADGRLHLADFGLARLLDEPHLTRSGEWLGTPAYMSPEQVRAGSPGAAPIDHQTDIYSLGVTLYELLLGVPPYEGEGREQLVSAICGTPPRRPRSVDSSIPRDLETVCLRALEKEPHRRYASAALLAEDLRRFVDGRPILARRVSPAERGLLWVRRHKAAAGAVAAACACAALALALVVYTHGARRAEAARLVEDAYGHLVFYDYRDAALVQPQLARAAELGADSVDLTLARALAALGAADQVTAIRELEQARAAAPDDVRSTYLLAWAHYRDGARETALDLLAGLEQQPRPTTPDAWFFRGLALHFLDPAGAMTAYDTAGALRARAHAFFPQAVVNLARARNQQMYSTRRLEGVADADASLRQLIAQRQYGALPYYLLSITHRLAGEIQAYQAGAAPDAGSAELATALELARAGQTVDPNDFRCATAESECLETLGDYAGAIAARTRAIALAPAGPPRCEGYHYRWRLHFWMGALEEAAADLALHATCVPDSRFYETVYPALLAAETGRLDAARGLARSLAVDDPTSANAVLWSATTLRLLGGADEADALLGAHAGQIDFERGLEPHQTPAWLQALYLAAQAGSETPAVREALHAAGHPPRLAGELAFHVGAARLGSGDRTGAKVALFEAFQGYDGELGYTYHGKLLWERLRRDPGWPAWVAPLEPVGGTGPPAD